MFAVLRKSLDSETRPVAGEQLCKFFPVLYLDNSE